VREARPSDAFSVAALHIQDEREQGHAVPPGFLDAFADAWLRDLLGKGLAGTVFLTTDDCWATYRELKDRGVEFIGEPEEQMYGIDVGFRDPSGNNVRLSQLKADFGR
jgi:uncharacterized glyoxalase superfamily protein PhnB